MRGSVKHQAGYILSIHDRHGHSKHNDKAEARKSLAREGRSASPQNVAAKTGINGNATNEQYHSRICTLGQYCRDNYGMRDMSRITAEMVRDFMSEKIDADVAYSTWNGYSAAFGKMDTALTKITGESPGIKAAVENLRAEAKAELPRTEGRDRAYKSPNDLLTELERHGEAVHLVATIQREMGLRFAEASRIDAAQLRDGELKYIAKGGQRMERVLRPETEQRLEVHLREHGSLQVSSKEFYRALKEACKEVGVRYEASHGLRYTFAQERYAELRTSGMSRLEALGQVSEEMSHHRVDITLRYLAGNDY
jgi:integrase